MTRLSEMRTLHHVLLTAVISPEEHRHTRGRRRVVDHLRVGPHTRKASARPVAPRAFRPDVEGLRAVAIVLVVLYHCKTFVTGGYVGVDVFFVISGFLITTQLVRELTKTGSISLRGFYSRRVRRILPAATVTTVFTVVFSGLLLSPVAAMRVFSDARSAAIFGANIHFAAVDADYFNADLPPSPIQHYWSLSVEEQFYLVWPLLLVVASLVWFQAQRRSAPGRRHARLPVVIAILGSLAIISFAGCVLQTDRSSSSAYYSIFTRMWELAAGALVALSLPRCERLDRRAAAALTWIGIACIAIAALAFDNSTPYPGDAAVLPVAGAAAIVIGGSCAGRRWGAEILLGTPPFQRIGAWSYSWYLWHWPVLILAPALLGHPLSQTEALAMAALSLLLAVISFVLVEQPIRRMQIIVRRPSIGLASGAALIATPLAVVALAGPIFASLHAGPAAAAPILDAGKPSMAVRLSFDLRRALTERRVPSNLTPALTAASDDKPLIDKNGCLLVDAAIKSRGCVYGDKSSRISVVLFGDSHAAAWFPALNIISIRHHWRLVVLAKSGCPAPAVNLIRYARLYTNCPIWRRDAERQIAALHPSLVFVAYSQYMHGARRLAGVPTGYGGTWLNGTEATFKLLHRSAKRVVYATDVPFLPQLAPDCVSNHMSDVRACDPARRIAIRYPGVTAAELRLAARNHINTVDVTPWFCTSTACPVIVGNILVYRDDQHMVPEWSRFLVPLLAKAITPIMDGPPSGGARR